MILENYKIVLDPTIVQKMRYKKLIFFQINRKPKYKVDKPLKNNGILI